MCKESIDDLISISTFSIIVPMLAMCSAPSWVDEMGKTRSERLLSDPDIHVFAELPPPLPSLTDVTDGFFHATRILKRRGNLSIRVKVCGDV